MTAEGRPAQLPLHDLGLRGWAIVFWGLGGVLGLLAQAIVKLTPVALEPLVEGRLSQAQGAIYAGWVIVNAYAEGYRGFQRRFAPRVLARAFHLARHPRPAHLVAAPLFTMSLFHATRRQMARAWSLLVGITCLVLVVRQLAQPWRGIVDGGVVVGLVWGAISILVLLVRTVRAGACPAPVDLPGA